MAAGLEERRQIPQKARQFTRQNARFAMVQMDKARRESPLPEKESVNVDRVIALRGGDIRVLSRLLRELTVGRRFPQDVDAFVDIDPRSLM